MVDYEKGSPAWDIGIMMTRHPEGCARRSDLHRTQRLRQSGKDRLESAMHVVCSCGAGNSTAETTSLKKEHHEPTSRSASLGSR